MVNTENYRKNIWYDPKHSAGVSGPEKLYQVVQVAIIIGRFKIMQFLNNIKMPIVYRRRV
jgi:hypothetical protein